MNLIKLINQEIAATRETLYTVHQNGFDLTDAMSELEAEMWKTDHSHLYANLQIREVKYG